MRKIKLCFYGTMAIIMFLASCVGCVSVGYSDPNGAVFNYTRWLGTQKISGLRIVKDKDGLVKFELDTQESTEGKVLSDLAETIKNFSSTLKVP